MQRARLPFDVVMSANSPSVHPAVPKLLRYEAVAPREDLPGSTSDRPDLMFWEAWDYHQRNRRSTDGCAVP